MKYLFFIWMIIILCSPFLKKPNFLKSETEILLDQNELAIQDLNRELSELQVILDTLKIK